MSRPKEALEDYNEALSIRKQLADDFPTQPEFRQDLAKSYRNRGFALSAAGRRKDAEKDYDEALSIYKQLAADFPSRPEFLQGLARSHVSRGQLPSATDRLKDAEQDYDQAVSIYKQLAADFPPDWSSARTWSQATSAGAFCGVSRAGPRRRSRTTTRP
jgi:tetratricopeptide (TPR) repeat protein